jgi:hypothetical protein
VGTVVPLPTVRPQRRTGVGDIADQVVHELQQAVLIGQIRQRLE